MKWKEFKNDERTEKVRSVEVDTSISLIIQNEWQLTLRTIGTLEYRTLPILTPVSYTDRLRTSGVEGRGLYIIHVTNIYYYTYIPLILVPTVKEIWHLALYKKKHQVRITKHDKNFLKTYSLIHTFFPLYNPSHSTVWNYAAVSYVNTVNTGTVSRRIDRVRAVLY